MRAFCKRHKVFTFIVSFFVLGFIYLYIDLYPKHDPNAPTEVDGDPVPPRRHPFVYYFDQSLLGIDEDNDGVMDEFELWVNENIEESTERIILKLLAKKSHEQIRSENLEDIKSINREIHKLLYCHTNITYNYNGFYKYLSIVLKGNFARRSFTDRKSSMISGSIGFSPSNLEDISTICPYTNEVLKYFEDKKRKHMDKMNEISRKAMEERARKSQQKP